MGVIAKNHAIVSDSRERHPDNTLTTDGFYKALREMRKTGELQNNHGPLKLSDN